MVERSSLARMSLRARCAASALAVMVYALLFVPVYALLGRSAIALSIGPLIVAASLFELWGGVAMGLALVPLDVLLYLYTEGELVRGLGTNYWLSHTALLVFGVVVGYLRRGTRLLERELVERRTAEQALKESEAKYRNVVEQANDGIAIIQDGNVHYVSRRLAEMLDLEAADIVGHSFGQFIAPQYRALVQDRYVRRLRGEHVPSRYEVAFMRRDGSNIDVEINAGTMDYQGRPAALAVVRDMTARKVAERELRESKERMRTLIENIPVIFWVMDDSRRYIMQNSQDREIYGETIGRRLEQVVKDERLRLVWQQENDRVFAGERVHSSYSHPVRGQERTYEGVIVPVRVGDQIVAIEGVHWDVTERDQTEQTLRAYQQQLEGQNAELRKLLQAVEQSANVVVITDIGGRIEYANPKFTEITGYSVDEVLGQNPRVLQSGEHDEPYYRALWKTILSGREWRGEFHNRRKDGTLYWEEATIAPVHDESGTITHFVAVKEDITDRKEAAALLAERLRFEALLSELSAAFTGLTSDQFDREIAHWMLRVSAFLNVDRSRLYRLSEDQRYAESVYAYSSSGSTLPDSRISRQELPYVFDLVLSGEVFVLSTPDDLPESAAEDKTFFEAYGIRAFLVVPLRVGGTILGALAFSSVRPHDSWPEDLVQRLRLVGEVFANAWLRQRTETRLRRYAERLEVQHRLDQAILEAESPEAVIHAALTHLSRIVPSRQSCVFEVEPDSGRAACLAVLESDGTYDRPAASSDTLDAVSLGALLDGEAVLVDGNMSNGTSGVLSHLLNRCGMGLTIAVPLRVQGRLVGTINLDAGDAGPIPEGDLDVVREIADSLAIALHQARLREQTQLDSQIKASLLQEVNHRVGNNLTAIIGLMHAERRYARAQNRAAVEVMVERLSRRVEGMVEVHRLLSQSQWSPVRLDQLAEQVVGAALKILADRQHVEVTVQYSALRVSPRQASSLALILNELTTNTIKHAMSGRTEGQLEIRISGGKRIRIEFRDDGPAYPDAVLGLEQVDVGLYLVQQLVLGLPGTLELYNEGGAVTVIAFDQEEGDRT